MIILREKEFGLFQSLRENKKKVNDLKSKLPTVYYKLKQVENVVNTSLIRDILNDGRTLRTSDGRFWNDRGINLLVSYLRFDEYDKETDSYMILYLIDSLFSEILQATLWYSFSSKKYYIQIGEDGKLNQVKNVRSGLSKFFKDDAVELLDEASKKSWHDSIYNYPKIIDLLKETSKLVKSNL